jgi:hypothetical protein
MKEIEMQKSLTIKLSEACYQNHARINKIVGKIDARNISKLISAVGLTANPRNSKVNKITRAIQETLETSPEMMEFKTKGLLVATSNCRPLERKNRFSLSFDNPAYEGLLDGGHNLLAIGIYILEDLKGAYPEIKVTEEQISKIKIWDDFITLWNLVDSDLRDESVESLNFQTPIEILYPTELEFPRFDETVFKISDARNNNAPLSETTKHNHRRYYEILKESLDPEINKKIEWKDNELGNAIKSADILAMALIPFIAIQRVKALEGLPQINQVNLYSSKQACVKTLNQILETELENNENQVKNPLLTSAFKMLEDLPRLYDVLYREFPAAYNSISSAFGNISSVKIYDKNKKAGGSYLRKAPLSKYYGNICKYQYSDGFIIPIFASLQAMMGVKNGKVIWLVESPDQFIKDHLPEFVENYIESTIKDNDYNPSVSGKSKGGYLQIALSIEMRILRSKIN